MNSAYTFSSDSSFVVYTAKQEAANRDELYRVNLANPGVATKLNAPLIAGGNVGMFTLRADDSRIGYMATQDSATVWEIYEVELATPAMSTKISAPMAAEGAFWFEYTQGESHMVYLADQDSDAAELYAVTVSSPGLASKLNGPLVSGGEVWEYEVIP